jgi:hypothetical protein
MGETFDNVLLNYLSHWLINVPVDRVPEDRRETVRRLRRQSGEMMGRVYTQMIERHRQARRELFQMLAVYANHERQFQQLEEIGPRVFNQAQQRELAKRLVQGRQLVEALAASARKSLGIMMQGPVVDGVILNQNHEVTDTTTFPLFPIVSDPDPAVPTMIRQLHDWALRFHEWLDDMGAE